MHACILTEYQCMDTLFQCLLTVPRFWGVLIFPPVLVGSTGTGVGYSMVRRGPPERVVTAVECLGAEGWFFYISNPFFETRGNINACITMEPSNIHACIPILDKSLGIEPSSCPQF